MRWLFVIGLSLEIAGAVLVAWTVFARSPVENREEALTKLGSNFWIVLFREREQAYVRAGLGLLGAGFAVQLAGHLIGFDWPEVALAVLIAAASGIGAFFIALRFGQRAVPLELTRKAVHRIRDERDGVGVETLDDVRTMRRLYASRMNGSQLRPRPYVVIPQISSGQWIFRCPECGPAHVGGATPGIPTVVCTTCSGEFPASFPDDREEIERLVLAHERVEDQNWRGETVDALRERLAAIRR